MARKKYADENSDDGQENLLHNAQQQQQLHQHQFKKNIFGSSSGSGGLGGHILQHHSQQGGPGKNGNKHRNELPKTSEESFFSVLKQLSNTGLTIREMPGDGNCLFRALADQLEGHPRNHLDHRRAVVQFMRDNRSDFEPFVEDDEPFERYIQTLSQPGTFAGNDAIVAFARLHNVTVVIHQLNSPAWLIHPSSADEQEQHTSNGREVHIAYHNGDHYNSVRKIGDDSDTPSNIKLGLEGHAGCTKQANTSAGNRSPPRTVPSTHRSSSSTVTRPEQSESSSNGYEMPFFQRRDEDYWVKDSADIERLVEDVMQQTDYPDHNFVRDTLMEFNFDMVSTVDFILSMSIIMSQTEVTAPEQQVPPVEELKKEPGSPPISPSSANQMPDLITAIQSEKQVSLDPLITSFEPNEPESKPACSKSIEITELDEIQLSIHSQNEKKPIVRETKVKMSCRQKKELKKRERKRESEKRKKGDSENTNPEAPIVTSTRLGTLNI